MKDIHLLRSVLARVGREGEDKRDGWKGVER